MTAVGIVGLGTMGGRMAGRFMAAGDEVVVWNRTRERVASLADHGAVPVIRGGR